MFSIMKSCSFYTHYTIKHCLERPDEDFISPLMTDIEGEIVNELEERARESFHLQKASEYKHHVCLCMLFYLYKVLKTNGLVHSVQHLYVAYIL